MLKVSVVVLAHDTDNKLISEETRTVTVNAHGAMILLTAKVSVGQLLTLRNSRSGDDVLIAEASPKPYHASIRLSRLMNIGHVSGGSSRAGLSLSSLSSLASFLLYIPSNLAGLA